MARPGTTEPDLVSEIRRLQSRLESLERKPVPQTIYDRYPATEASVIKREPMNIVGVQQNVWNSCAVSNVTGLKYDRVECRFSFENMMPAVLEGEFRLATFRHYQATDRPQKTIVTCTDAWKFTGMPKNAPNRYTLHAVSVRWLHGLQYGWDYGQGTDNAVYTLELQHRYAVQSPIDDRRRVFTHYMDGNHGTDYTVGNWQFGNGSNGVGPGNNWFFDMWDKNAKGGVPPYGWSIVDPQGDWYGSPQLYKVSSMEYCAGLPEDRAPDATPAGKWRAYVDAGGKMIRPASTVINERYI
jgi:hypothetical protein